MLFCILIFTRKNVFIILSQDYTITLYLNQYWKDERLAFSTDEEILTLSGDFAEKIWVPDTFFANDKNRYLHHKIIPINYIINRFQISI